MSRVQHATWGERPTPSVVRMLGKAVRFLPILALLLLAASCSGSANEARRDRSTLADGFRTVAGTELVGSVVPVLPISDVTAEAPRTDPARAPRSWWAVLKLDAPARTVVRRFGDQARSLGFRPDHRFVCAGGPPGCGSWQSDTARLEVETNTCPSCGIGGDVAWVSFQTTRDGSGRSPTKIPTRLVETKTFVPASTGAVGADALGPDVRVLAQVGPSACQFTVGEVTRNPDQVWERFNVYSLDDEMWESLRGSVGDLTVRQVWGGGGETITVTLLEGPGLPRPLLAYERCG